jgi:hypothetical protein
MEAELELWNQPEGLEAVRTAHELQEQLDDAIEELTAQEDNGDGDTIATPADETIQTPGQRTGGRTRANT